MNVFISNSDMESVMKSKGFVTKYNSGYIDKISFVNSSDGA